MDCEESDSPEETPSHECAQSAPQNSKTDEIALNSISWSHDNQCFTAGTSDGFQLYYHDKLDKPLRRKLSHGSFRIVEMLSRYNLFALVGGADNQQYPPDRVMLWDDKHRRWFSEIHFRSAVQGVKLRKDRVVVALPSQIHVFSLVVQKFIHHIVTMENPKGLCSISQDPRNFVLACPGLQPGEVRVEHFDTKVNRLIIAHSSRIAQLALTNDGLRLATASEKGTLIRVFNTLNGTCLQEVRRGADKAEIHSLAISFDVRWMVASSDKGTVHIYNLGDSSVSNSIAIKPTNNNRRSLFSSMKGVLPKYFSSEWSFAHFHVPQGTRYHAAFGAHNSILIVGMDGSFYRCSFDPVNGGEMTKQECLNILDADIDRKM